MTDEIVLYKPNEQNMDYFKFLSERRKLMAGIIKDAYDKLWK